MISTRNSMISNGTPKKYVEKFGLRYIKGKFGKCAKCGKEIYEGDIISISRTTLDEKNPTITDVYFKKGAFRWRHKDGSGSVIDFNSVCVVKGYEAITQDVEVIGNIYENSEILSNSIAPGQTLLRSSQVTDLMKDLEEVQK